MPFSHRFYKRYNKSFKRDICCFDLRSNFLVSVPFLINIGKEMSLSGFRICILDVIISSFLAGNNLVCWCAIKPVSHTQSLSNMRNLTFFFFLFYLIVR